MNGALMLSEVKRLRFISVASSVQNQSEIESLASRTSSAALQLRFAQNDRVAVKTVNLISLLLRDLHDEALLLACGCGG